MIGYVADDPYYCGLRARIPAFVQKALPPRNKPEGPSKPERNSVGMMGSGHVAANGAPAHHRYSGPPAPGHPMMWHAKSVDSGMGKGLNLI